MRCFRFFGILSPCFVLLKVILKFEKTVLLTLYSGWQIGGSTWRKWVFLAWIVLAINSENYHSRAKLSIAISIPVLHCSVIREQSNWILNRGCQRVYTWCVIKAKINIWRVNFTEKRSWFVNLWSSVRRDLPPEIQVTREFLLSSREILKIFQKRSTLGERFEVLPFLYVTREFF